ncbi:MAG: ABC transporter permease [Haliscomenobacter sp.]|nr:ABC transporter permease [Haliscomenobacter sp.]
MYKILRYSFYDLMRSRWTYFYFGFFLLFTLALLFLSSDVGKVIISLMNVILVLVPLIATMFGIMFYYNSREFTELLLAQQLSRTQLFLGQYLGLALSLSASLLLGVGLPFLFYGIFFSAEIGNFIVLLLNGVLLSFIFSGMAFWIALRHENRIKGFGLAIMMWLFFAVIYDGIFLLLLMWFSDYPLEYVSLGASLLNPVDLSRILILLKLDISALMGYTGAVFEKFLGTGLGIALSFLSLGFWILLPTANIRRVALTKDF